MLSLCAVLLLGATVADDTPAGTDLVARVEVGELAGEMRKGWDELEPLFAAWPSLGGVARSNRATWGRVAELVEEASGADLDRAGAVATVLIDVDPAGGGRAWAVVVRGAQPREPEGSDFLIDGHPAHRIRGRDVAWSIVDGALVAGNDRGVKRQVHQLATKKQGDEPIVARARRLRDRAPLSIAFELPEATRKQVGELLPNVGPLLEAVRGGTVVASPGRLWMQLSAGNDDGQDALDHGVRALVALLRASTALLEGGTEAIIGLDLLGARPKVLPSTLDAPALEKLADDWLQGFTVDAKIRRRPPRVIEAELALSSHRGLVAALGVMAVMLVPASAGPQAEAEVLLELLRRAQKAHHARSGEYVSCGPVPEQLPVKPIDWPAGTCFDALGFKPPAKIRFQLVAGVEEGELVLMARGDTDGDGETEIWVLRGNDVAMRPLLDAPEETPKPEPTKPTKPDKPTKPAKPTKPKKPDKPTKPAKPTKPKKK